MNCLLNKLCVVLKVRICLLRVLLRSCIVLKTCSIYVFNILVPLQRDDSELHSKPSAQLEHEYSSIHESQCGVQATIV